MLIPFDAGGALVRGDELSDHFEGAGRGDSGFCWVVLGGLAAVTELDVTVPWFYSGLDGVPAFRVSEVQDEGPVRMAKTTLHSTVRLAIPVSEDVDDNRLSSYHLTVWARRRSRRTG